MEDLSILTDEIIEELLLNTTITRLQFTKKPKENFWRTLDKYVLSKRKDIEVRLYGNFNQEWKDLSFLSELYHLQKLSIDECALCGDDLEPLKSIENLVELSIGENIDVDNPLSLEPIKKFKELKLLAISGVVEKICVLSEFKNLNKLRLHNLNTVEDFYFLDSLKELYSLTILSCPVKDINSLKRAKNLKYLKLGRISGLKDIGFLSFFSKMEFLEMFDLEVNKMPYLQNCSKLGRVSLIGMKELEDISNLSLIKNLEELAIYDATNFSPYQFIKFKNHKTLRVLHVEFNNDQKSNELKKLFANITIDFVDKVNQKYLLLT